MFTVNEKINLLRKEMTKENIDLYIVPTSDFHDSEYVSPYFMTRKFLSGFTGSAGTLVVSPKEAALFTDGRYFIQAERELSGSDILLMKSGEEGVPTVSEYVEKSLGDGGNIGFDGRVITTRSAKSSERLYAALTLPTEFGKNVPLLSIRKFMCLTKNSAEKAVPTSFRRYVKKWRKSPRTYTLSLYWTIFHGFSISALTTLNAVLWLCPTP